MTTKPTGIKHDQDKPDMSLMSSIALVKIAEVMTYGKKKYAAHNWRGGFIWSRPLSAALRHITSYLGGQDKDPETGLSHLAHAACCLMFLLEFEETHRELDDRYKGSTPNSLVATPSKTMGKATQRGADPSKTELAGGEDPVSSHPLPAGQGVFPCGHMWPDARLLCAMKELNSPDDEEAAHMTHGERPECLYGHIFAGGGFKCLRCGQSKKASNE